MSPTFSYAAASSRCNWRSSLDSRCKLSKYSKARVTKISRASIAPDRFSIFGEISKMKEPAIFRTSPKRFSAFARCVSARFACQIVVIMPPSNVKNINKPAATPSRLRLTNFSARYLKVFGRALIGKPFKCRSMSSANSPTDWYRRVGSFRRDIRTMLSKSPFSNFGFWILDCGFSACISPVWVSDFGLWTLDFGLIADEGLTGSVVETTRSISSKLLVLNSKGRESVSNSYKTMPKL